MRLINAYLDGYRRFGERTKVNLDGKLIALVGPNEAGKTTILQALLRLQDEQPISDREKTRQVFRGDDRIAVEALWLIEPADIEAIDIPPGSETPRWLAVKKMFGGAIGTELKPKLRRDRGPREAMVASLRRVSGSKWAASLSDDESAFVQPLDSLRESLESDEGTLAPGVIDAISQVADLLASRDLQLATPKYVADALENLRALAVHEAAEHPTIVAEDVLRTRTRPVIKFDLGARELASEYDLQAVAPDPPLALANLAALADLDLEDLRDGIETDQGHAIELMERANAVLQRRVNEAWRQGAPINVHLRNDGFLFRIFVRTTGGTLQDIAERSDGLRTFLALVAFTNEYASAQSPILLIDEAEIHLHYDAQADLVQMLGRQQQAAHIIYTTHSAGCLPADLGTGVRLIKPDGDGDRSKVTNWPWEIEGGFGPLLLGMGAATMAFVPTRAAVIGEGAGEVVLLPTLIRQAIGLEALPYQIAPGAAEATSQAIEHIDSQGSRVVWLVDGDQGGADNKKNIGKNLPTDRIVTLGGKGSGLAVEDLLDAKVYAAAVNEELRRSHSAEAAQIEPNDLPATGRPNFVSAWCDERNLPEPNKGAIVHRAADQRSDRKLGSPAHDELLGELHTELMARLDIKPDEQRNHQA